MGEHGLLNEARNSLKAAMGRDAIIRENDMFNFEVDSRDGSRIEIEISNMRLNIVDFESPHDGRQRDIYRSIGEMASLLGLVIDTSRLPFEVRQMIQIPQPI